MIAVFRTTNFKLANLETEVRHFTNLTRDWDSAISCGAQEPPTTGTFVTFFADIIPRIHTAHKVPIQRKLIEHEGLRSTLNADDPQCR